MLFYEVFAIFLVVLLGPGIIWMSFIWLVKKAFPQFPKPRLRLIRKDY